MTAGVPAEVDVTMHRSVHADVTGVGRQAVRNLDDVEAPAPNLIGVAQSASQGAITARLEGVPDAHVHPAIPRTLRLSTAFAF